jgi:hypothetical protein
MPTKPKVAAGLLIAVSFSGLGIMRIGPRLVGADDPRATKNDPPGHYLKIRLEPDMQDAGVEARGRLLAPRVGPPETPELFVGTVAVFRLGFRDEELRERAKRLSNQTVLVEGAMSLVATQRRSYVTGTLLASRPIIDVRSLEAADDPKAGERAAVQQLQGVWRPESVTESGRRLTGADLEAYTGMTLTWGPWGRRRARRLRPGPG